jgi:predicted DNA-binding transcriptional regulator YafY
MNLSRGKRESQWLVVRRCLAIVHRVQRGPASWEELVQAVLEQAGAEAYGEAEGQALHRRLENDLHRVRECLHVDLGFDRQAGGYVLRNTEIPLLDLPDEHLATVAWLEQTFDPGSPQHDEVHALLGQLRACLDPQRRAVLERCHTALVVDLSQRDDDEIRPAVQNRLAKAVLEHRQVELTYLSPQYADGQPRRHTVEPYRQYFDTTRGHYYLRAYCRCVEGPAGREEPHRYVTYRVGRILEVQVLPQKLSPLPPAAPSYAVEYELAPEVARLGITRQPRIEIRQVTRREDGSVLVYGETDDLFWAVQALLHYGPNCRVVGGPEMLRAMEAVIGKMAEMYTRT